MNSPAGHMRLAVQVAQEAEARAVGRPAEGLGLDRIDMHREQVAGLGAFDGHRSRQRMGHVAVHAG